MEKRFRMVGQDVVELRQMTELGFSGHSIFINWRVIIVTRDQTRTAWEQNPCVALAASNMSALSTSHLPADRPKLVPPNHM